MAGNSRVGIDRRSVLAWLMAGVAVPSHVLAQQNAPENTAFSFEVLDERMRVQAATPYVSPQPLTQGIGDLTYDDYRNIYFRPEQSRWMDESLPFHVSAFHPIPAGCLTNP